MLDGPYPIEIGRQRVERQRQMSDRLSRTHIPELFILTLVAGIRAVAPDLQRHRDAQGDNSGDDQDDVASLLHLKSRREKINVAMRRSAAI